MKSLKLLLMISMFMVTTFSATAQDTLRVAYFSKDVPSIDSLDQSFDPDSYAVITQIFDSLIHADLDGNFIPGLATKWTQISPTKWNFKLRKGVTFHNGEPLLRLSLFKH